MDAASRAQARGVDHHSNYRPVTGNHNDAQSVFSPQQNMKRGVGGYKPRADTTGQFSSPNVGLPVFIRVRNNTRECWSPRDYLRATRLVRASTLPEGITWPALRPPNQISWWCRKVHVRARGRRRGEGEGEGGCSWVLEEPLTAVADQHCFTASIYNFSNHFWCEPLIRRIHSRYCRIFSEIYLW